MYYYCYTNITIRFCMKIDSLAKVFYTCTFFEALSIWHMKVSWCIKIEMDGIDRNVKPARSEMKPLVRMQ